MFNLTHRGSGITCSGICKVDEKISPHILSSFYVVFLCIWSTLCKLYIVIKKSKMYLHKIFFYWWWCFRTRLENRANDFNFSWNVAGFLSKTLDSLPTTPFVEDAGEGISEFEFQVVVFPVGWWMSPVAPRVWFTMGEGMLSKHTMTHRIWLYTVQGNF